MKAVKLFLGFLLFIIIATLLHYYLPQRDIVRIVGTDVKRMDVSKGSPFWDRPDAGTNRENTRDVRFINAVRKNGKESVYRNEDTEWSFPFYLKFDSGDLNARAQNLAQQKEQWVAIRHYGWRIKLFSIFPNATSVKKLDGPNVFLVPWFNIFFIGLWLIIFFSIWRVVKRWKTKNVDPITDKIGDELSEAAQTARDHADAAGDSLSKKGSAIGRLWRKLFGTSKKTK
jgi:hypothetical protein